MPNDEATVTGKPSSDVVIIADTEKLEDTVSKNRPWKLVCSLLLLSTLFQSIKPSDPYLPAYFVRDFGITREVVNEAIYPGRTYTYFLALLPITYLSEYVVGYVPVIVVGLFCRLATQFLLYYGTSIFYLKLGMAIFGFSQATKIIYSAHVYRMIPLHAFHRVTGYLRASNMSAHVFGGVIGGWLVGGRESPNYFVPFTISQTSVSFGVFSFLCACALTKTSDSKDESKCFAPRIKSMADLKDLFVSIYSSPSVVLWSMWWWVGFAIIELVLDYQSVLFVTIDSTVSYEGYVISAARLTGAVSALVAGASRSFVDSNGYAVLALGSAAMSIILFASAGLSNVYVAYGFFILFFALHEFCFCSANAQVAIRIPSSKRGIALLSNTLVSVALQSLIQLLTGIFGCSIQVKYQVYGVLMGLIGVSIFIMSRVIGDDEIEDESESAGKKHDALQMDSLSEKNP